MRIHTLLGLLLVFAVLSSCAPEVEIEENFHFYTDDTKRSEDKPTPDEADKWYVSYTKRLIIRDVSTPKDGVTSRAWYVDNEPVTEYKDKLRCVYEFETTGEYKVTFCANTPEFKTDKCISKWVRIEDRTPKPSLAFLSPATSYPETEDRTFDIEILTANIPDEAEDDIELLVNGTAQSFEFKDGKIRKKINLKKGENEVIARATVGVRTTEKTVSIERKTPPPPLRNNPPPNTGEGSKTVAPPPLPPPPTAVVKIQTPKNNITTEQNKYQVAVRATGFGTITKNLLKLTCNGNPVTFKLKDTLWVADVPLKTGSNVIEAKANTISDKIVINSTYRPTLPNLGVAGAKTAGFQQTCSAAIGQNYSFTITPKQPIELMSFKVHSSLCGGVEAKLSSTQGTESIKSTLVRGVSQIEMDVDAYMEAGITYTVSLNTFAGYGNCSLTTAPELLDASKCNLTTSPNTAFSVDGKGKAVIFELNYLYKK